MRIIFLIISLILLPAQALDIDEKVIARILDVSNSKRTILLNKGSDDELAVGEHAKISIPDGMIARGVVTRVSPARSVWSVYRFYNKEKVMKNIAVTVKMASPIKLTTDETKSLGMLAEKYGKKEEDAIPKLNSQEKQRQKALARNLFIKTKMIKAVEAGIDYSALNETSYPPPKLDQSVDWSALDGRKDLAKVDQRVDFSTLK